MGEAAAYSHGVGLADAAIARRRARARARGAARRGLLIAEGDSWFDYPFQDVVESLEDHHGFEVEAVCHKGETLEDMAFDEHQLDRLTRAFGRIADRLDRGAPEAVLLSGGGNDLAGEEFRVLLNHARSGAPGANEKVVEGIVEDRLRDAMASLIGTVQRLCVQFFDRELPVVVHGYGHPVPDGRGHVGGAWVLPGPWLDPAFRRKGYDPSDAARFAQNTIVVGQLIDRFNAMLQTLASVLQTNGKDVRYVDLRPLLTSGPDYRRDWANELHPTRSAFERVAAAIASAL
jgi:hypothetical protein